MSRLANLIADLHAQRGLTGPSGIAKTGLDGVWTFWNEADVPRSPLLYDAGLVIVAQGRKTGYLGGRRFVYDADSCLVLGVPVAFECESEGSPQEPLLGIRVDIDIKVLHSLVARFAGKLDLDARASSGVEPVPMQGKLLEAAERLIESLGDPLDRQVVGAAALEEVLYRVLRSEQGSVLFDLTRHHGAYASVARALERMHKDYRASLAVEDLAKQSAMSVSAFHRVFKQVTGETPVQYLKKLRLLEAKGMIVFEGKRVEEAAYGVGYASPSQFSREFKRYFEVPPSEARSLPYTDGVSG